MRMFKFFCASLLAVSAFTAANAGNINATAARAAANSFLKQHAATAPGSLRAPAMSDIKLAHAEPSAKVAGANDYYAFNITGGGFVIIAGEDRAVQVLGYSDKGHIDFNNLPTPLKGLLDSYKKEIEFLQTYKGNDLVISNDTKLNATGGVDPLIKTTWGQELPYYLQCPVMRGEYSAVGCVATAMAQVMNYWQYPTSSAAISRYYLNGYGYVSALPATTFDYSLLLDSYCHWDYENSQLVQDTYTDAQAQEVAKLGRYCGQAVEMQYDPDGSGAYTNDQLSAMKNFGFTSSQLYSKSGGGWWGSSSNYTTAQWEAMIKTDLDAGRPILYSANDPQNGGHAFICDGYNSNGYFHFNLGWYGTCDGWYVSTTLSMVHRDGDQLNFSSGHEMITGIQPPTYCIVDADALNANSDLLVLGESLSAQAQNVTFRTSYNGLNFAFALADANGSRIASSSPVNVNKNSFVQGSAVDGTIKLPTDLASGTYDLQFNYYTTDANALQTVSHAEGQLVVVGNVAKFNEPFNVNDVTTLINYILNSHPSEVTLNVNDVTTLIAYILNN